MYVCMYMRAGIILILLWSCAVHILNWLPVLLSIQNIYICMYVCVWIGVITIGAVTYTIASSSRRTALRSRARIIWHVIIYIRTALHTYNIRASCIFKPQSHSTFPLSSILHRLRWIHFLLKFCLNIRIAILYQYRTYRHMWRGCELPIIPLKKRSFW